MKDFRQEDIFKIPMQGFELMSLGLDFCNRLSRLCADSAESAPKGRPEQAPSTHFNSFIDSMDQYFRPLYFYNDPELLRLWQNFFPICSISSTPHQTEIKRMADFSKAHQDRISRLAGAWIDCLGSIGDKNSIEPKADGRGVRHCLDISESLLNSCISFISDETRDSFRYIRSSIEDQIRKYPQS